MQTLDKKKISIYWVEKKEGRDTVLRSVFAKDDKSKENKDFVPVVPFTKITNEVLD